MSDVGADPKGRYQPGLFTNSGTTDLSELAELLFIEDGFHQINRNSDIGPARELEELISRAIRGERILNTEATEREYQQGLEAKKRAEIDRLANEYGVALKDGGKRRPEDAIEADLEDAIAFEIKKAGESFAGIRNAALSFGVSEEDIGAVEDRVANDYDGDSRRDYMVLMYRDLANAIQEKIDEQVLRSEDGIQREEGTGARQDAGVSEAAKGAPRATGEGREEPFSLSSQTEGDLAAKAAREADETLANKALADSQREAFTLSYPEGSAAPKAVPSKQTGLFAADGSAKASAIAGKPVAEMSDDQLRNIARGLSPTYGDAAVDKAKTELRRRDEAPKAKQTPADAGVSVSKPEKVSAGETATDFIRAPDGSIDFGEITDEQARVMRRQAGKIRLERGWHDASTHKGSGLVHVEARHGKQIRDLGYASVEKFISDAVHQINEVWKPDATAQMVAIVNDRHGRAIFVELQPARDEAGDYYTIRSAFPVSQGYAEQKEKSEGWALLWPKSPVLEAAPGSQTDSVGNSRKSGESAPMAIGQSSGETLAQSTNQRNSEKVGAGETASDRDSFTLERLNQATGGMESVSFTRGERVKVAGSFPMVTGEISGISHAERRAKVGGVWYDFGYIYPMRYDEFKNIRQEIGNVLDLVESRLNGNNSIESMDMIRGAENQARERGLFDEYKQRIQDLRLLSSKVSNEVLESIKEKNPEPGKQREQQSDRAKAEEEEKPRQVIRMTMDEWKRVHRDSKGTIDGRRSALYEGRLFEVEIVKDANLSSDGRPVDVDAPAREVSAPTTGTYTLAEHAKVMAAIDAGEISLSGYRAAFERFMAHRDALSAEFMAMKKPELMAAARAYRDENKAAMTKNALRRMMGSFVLRDSVTYAYGANYDDTIRNYVNAETEDTLKAYAENQKAAQDERAADRKKMVDGIQDPQRLDDFQNYIRVKKSDGMDFAAARMTLTPEQRARFDELVAMQTRGGRQAMADKQRTDVRVAAATAEGQIVETKHTKTGEPLFVVKAAERVERDVYNLWNATAKKMGGYYSSFRGNGAVPGFQFKTRENANAFLEFIGGKAEKAKETIQARRDAFADDKSQSAVERLREMAERIDERADESLGRERQANTARRARFAASAEAAANGDKAMAQTMRNIAQAIESGDAKFLDRVRQKAQIEMLTSLVSSAQWDYWKAKYPTYAERERHKGERPVQEVADYAQFPQYTAFRSDLAKLGRQMIEIDGAKKLGQRLLAVADDVTDAYLEFAKENLHKVSTFKRSDGGMAQFASKGDAETAISRSGYKGKAIVLPFKRGQNIIIQSPAFARENGLWTGDDDKRITLNADFGAELVAKSKEYIRPPFEVPGSFNYVADKLARLKALGIETPAEFRAMLREFIGMKQAPKAPDRIKELERSMVGRAKDGLDFFPTPAGAVQDMLDAAELQEGMSVLEPSAGMGHIADLIREAGVEPDVVELSNERKELLEAKGYNIVGRDFMELKPDDWTFGDTYSAEDGTQGVLRGGNRERVRLVGENGETLGYFNREDLTPVKKNGGGYDRIIMNPPFGDRRDAQHVRHAFDLLAPGGRLVAIMGEGVFFGQDKKATAFREWLESVGGSSEKLEDGTFLDPSLPVNTGTSARLVVIDKSKKGMESRAALKPVDTASPEFKRWFGDWEDPKAWSSKARAPVSMAVDWKTKKPLKLFHATNSDFSAFDVGRPTINTGTFGDIETSRAGIFATPDAQFASEYLRAGSGQNIMPIYMRLVSPMDMRDGLDWQHISDIVSNSNGGITESDFRHIEPTAAWKLFDGDFGRRFVDAARRAGYDGAIIREESSNSGDNHDVYVAFSPTQIKSAIGNTGGFSDSNPSILESRASADDLQFASDVLAQLGDDEYFRWPVSKSADLRTVFKEVYPGAKYFGEHTRADERDETGADHRHVFVNHLGKRFHVYTRDNGSVWLDVSQLANSDGGNQIYAAVANWAHNAGFKFQGDPVGVSADAVIRRTVNMLSSALRFGTTKHLDVAREQAKGDPDNGVEPLKWGSNDVENVRELIHTFTTTLFNKFPGLARYHYDFNRKDFFDKNGERVSPDRFREGAEKDQARDARAGEATLRRGVFLKSLISSESSERPGILATVLKLHGARTLGGLRQFLSKTTPAQAGVSVSGDTNTIRDVVDRFRSEFKGAAALDIRVVNSTAEIPAHYRPSLYAEGVFHDDAGLIYLVARNLQDRNGKPNTARAFQVLLHEAVGHFGLSKMMGERFSRITARVKEAARAKGEVKNDIYQPGHPDYATIEAVRLRYPDATEDEVAQEVLARMAETDPGRTLFGYVRAMVRQWVRDTARALGIDLNITTEELNDLVALASAYMRRGDNLAEDQASSGIVAASEKVGDGETVPGRIHAGATPYPNRTSDNTAEVDLSIHSDSLIVNADSVSKVVDENGEPLVDTDTRESRRAGMESRRTISGNSGRAYTAEQQAAFRNVGREVETPTFKERVAGLWRDIGKKMEQGIADQFAPLKDLDKDAYLLARMSKGADGALEAMLMYGKAFIRDGVYDVDVKDGGVIDKLLRPLGKEADDFLWWVAGNRAADLAKQGRENLMSGNDIKALQDLAAGKLDFDYTLPNGQATRDRATAYAAAQKVFAEFNKSVLDIAEQSGLIDGQARAVWESDFYVPFYRDMDGDKPTFPNVKSGLVRQKAFERLKGGDEKLHSDLLANTILNWSHLLHAAAKNRAAKAALEAAEKVGAATWIPVTENGAVSYRDGGDEYFYRVDDPFVLDAVTALEFSGFSGPAMKAMGAFKRWLTIGVTASPTFKVRNLIRDSISAIGTAELSYNLAKNLKQGYAATGRDSQTYASMLAGGGHIRFGAMIEGNRSDHVRRLVEKGVDPDTILDDPSKLKRVWSRNVMPLIDAWNEIGDRSENINRAAIYEQLRAKGMSHADASLAARDLLDFSMGGTWAAVRFLTAVVPFANARIQGLYKLGRAAKDDPKRLGYVTGAVALASLALLAVGYDDDDWKKREDWDRDTYWWFKIGGVAFRIPKPFEIGAIGTLAERSAELLFDKEMDGQRFGDRIGNMVLNTFAMNPVPQMFKPLIDLYANRDSFRALL